MWYHGAITRHQGGYQEGFKIMAVKFQEATGQDTQTELRAAANRERDETQKALDGRMGSVVKRWIEAQRPAPEKSPHDRVVVGKTDNAALKAMIRRAGTLHKVGVKFFKDRPNGDGSITVKYVPIPAPVNGKKG